MKERKKYRYLKGAEKKMNYPAASGRGISNCKERRKRRGLEPRGIQDFINHCRNNPVMVKSFVEKSE